MSLMSAAVKAAKPRMTTLGAGSVAKVHTAKEAVDCCVLGHTYAAGTSPGSGCIQPEFCMLQHSFTEGEITWFTVHTA